ncbi:hypothetical protein K227x_00900 [Rubripirellula lacrimiformis]|uniref:PEP-CTERM protein-sorting domain-containing protein n=1 Tax=Rubripirellula lacrimiformis TaxID=1930273 RepID=A0A517N3L2_9BACT|nr:hypothetical protein [Rubripirellula lacrimiformis]QDT01723.1 hypothetical protein K227x_00900 [Rubripirellula lacrimiformis]
MRIALTAVCLLALFATPQSGSAAVVTEVKFDLTQPAAQGTDLHYQKPIPIGGITIDIELDPASDALLFADSVGLGTNDGIGTPGQIRLNQIIYFPAPTPATPISSVLQFIGFSELEFSGLEGDEIFCLKSVAQPDSVTSGFNINDFSMVGQKLSFDVGHYPTAFSVWNTGPSDSEFQLASVTAAYSVNVVAVPELSTSIFIASLLVGFLLYRTYQRLRKPSKNLAYYRR